MVFHNIKRDCQSLRKGWTCSLTSTKSSSFLRERTSFSCKSRFLFSLYFHLYSSMENEAGIEDIGCLWSKQKSSFPLYFHKLLFLCISRCAESRPRSTVDPRLGRSRSPNVPCLENWGSPQIPFKTSSHIIQLASSEDPQSLQDLGTQFGMSLAATRAWHTRALGPGGLLGDGMAFAPWGRPPPPHALGEGVLDWLLRKSSDFRTNLVKSSPEGIISWERLRLSLKLLLEQAGGSDKMDH